MGKTKKVKKKGEARKDRGNKKGREKEKGKNKKKSTRRGTKAEIVCVVKVVGSVQEASIKEKVANRQSIPSYKRTPIVES